MGNACRHLPRLVADAVPAYRSAIDTHERLVSIHREVAQYQNNLAVAHHDLANLLNEQGKVAEADRLYRRAIDLRLGLTRRFPGVPECQTALGDAHFNPAVLLGVNQHFAEAVDVLKKALDVRCSFLCMSVRNFGNCYPPFRRGSSIPSSRSFGRGFAITRNAKSRRLCPPARRNSFGRRSTGRRLR